MVEGKGVEVKPLSLTLNSAVLHPLSGGETLMAAFQGVLVAQTKVASVEKLEEYAIQGLLHAGEKKK